MKTILAKLFGWSESTQVKALQKELAAEQDKVTALNEMVEDLEEVVEDLNNSIEALTDGYGALKAAYEKSAQNVFSLFGAALLTYGKLNIPASNIEAVYASEIGFETTPTEDGVEVKPIQLNEQEVDGDTCTKGCETDFDCDGSCETEQK